jgi:hypothetical protein
LLPKLFYGVFHNPFRQSSILSCAHFRDVRLVAADAAQGFGRVSNFKLVHTVIAKITVFFFGCLRRQAHLAI